MWKDFIYFSWAEKRAIVVLSVLILAVLAVRFIPRTAADNVETDSSFDEEYAAFMASVKEKENKVTVYDNRREAPETPVHLQRFDPNHADSISLIRLGLKPWVAGNVLRYRAKGGRFRKPDDFRKIYGLSDEEYKRVLPYIFIAESPTRPNAKDERYASIPIPATTADVSERDTLQRVFKYPAGTVLNLNTADTTELKKIPGIGSATARRITGYRNRLGGFYSPEQLQDINLDVERFAPWFTTEGFHIDPINLNKVNIDRLRNHPYFNFYQARAIIELRKKKGSLTGLHELALLEEFTEDDFERMKYYVTFE